MPDEGLRVAGTVRRGGFELTVDVAVAPGEMVAVLGPNGAGKSTLLRALAGLHPLSHGRLTVGGRVLDDAGDGTFVEPEDRRAGVVFQDARLFGHLRVIDNVAFGLRARGIGRSSARGAAGEWLETLGIADLSTRRPGQLSGGQAQRVAVARALVSHPDYLLFDEPFAALDALTRSDVQGELRRHLQRYEVPSVLVTHDVIDALVLAQRIVVIEAGRVVQVGTPAQITSRPATAYVAKLVGMNLYASSPDGRLSALSPAGLPAPGPLLVAVRPSAITVQLDRPADSETFLASRYVWAGRVAGLSPRADRVLVEVSGSPGALVEVTASAVAELGLAAGVDVWLSTNAHELVPYSTAPV